MDIASRAMIVRFNASQWTARRIDKTATQETLDAHSASSDAGRFNKQLIPKEALLPIQQVVGAARTYVYANTLPWSDNGDRALLSTKYFDFMQRMSEFRRMFNDEVDKFVTSYNEHRDRAALKLNSLFDARDYPDECEVRSKFGFEFGVMPLPTAGDFRVDMGKDAADEVRKQIEAQVQSMTKAAMDSVWEEVRGTISRLKEQMDGGKRLHESLLTNLEDLLERLPALNLTGDDRLDVLRQAAKDALSGYDIKELRQDDGLRRAVSGEADRILKQMEALYAH